MGSAARCIALAKGAAEPAVAEEEEGEGAWATRAAWAEGAVDAVPSRSSSL